MSEDDTPEVEVLPKEKPVSPSYKHVDEEKEKQIVEYRKQGLSYSEIGKLTNVSKSTAYKVTKRLTDKFPELAELDDYRENKIELLDAMQYRLLKSMADKDLSEEKISSIMSAFDKLYKAKRVESGQSTENIAQQVFHATEKKDT